MEIKKNLGINQTFIFKNNRFIVAEGKTCKGCHFDINGHGCLSVTGVEVLPICSELLREDRKNVIFIKI